VKSGFKITRRWTLVTWLFLTCGIILGMHWAYAVLGWGGYWGWDPVENASLHALAHRYRLPPLRHDAGEARHDEELERLAHLRPPSC
jgi:ABC-type transport system involved in cytochrome c biogenesis permease subunit